MAGGIGDKNSLEYWNSPHHWLMSDIQSNVMRGGADNLARAKALNETLGILTGQANVKTQTAGHVQAAQLASVPGLMEQEAKNTPTGITPDSILKTYGIGGQKPPAIPRLSAGWSLIKDQDGKTMFQF